MQSERSGSAAFLGMIEVFVLDESGKSRELVATVVAMPAVTASSFVVGGYTRDPKVLALGASSSNSKKIVLSGHDEKEKKRLSGFAGYLQGRGKAGVVKREGGIIYLLPAKAGENADTIQCVIVMNGEKPLAQPASSSSSSSSSSLSSSAEAPPPPPQPAATRAPAEPEPPKPSGLLGSLISKNNRTDGARMLLQNKKAEEERNKTVDYITRMEKELHAQLKEFSEDTEQAILRLEPMDKDYRYVVHDITGQFENLLSASCGDMDERHVVIYKKGGEVPEGVELHVNKADLKAASAKAARKTEAAARRADAAQFTAVDFSKLQQMSTAVNINKRDRRSIEELEQEQKELKEKKAKH